MAILVESGRAAVAAAIRNQSIHLAWGTGDPAWDNLSGGAQPEDTSAIALVNEIGRRTVTSSMFVQQDAQGTIVVSQGSFSPTPNDTPSKYLYLRFMFELNDAPGSFIRELGVFVGSTVNTAGTNGYWNVADVVDPGRLLVLENIARLQRSSQIKQQFEFVIQF